MSQRYPIVDVYFCGEENDYDVLSVDSGGMVVLWEASMKPGELILKEQQKKEEEEGDDQPEVKMTYKKLRR